MLEIEKTLVLNTQHITVEASKWLDSSACGMVIDPYAYGWRFYAGATPIPYAMPHKSIKACVNLAQANDCLWVKFDRDGPLVKELPTYKWE